MLKYVRVVFACCAALLFSGLTTSAHAQSSVSYFLFPGQTLTPDKFYYSPGNKYFLVFQSSDGNLVIYKVGTPNNTALWNTGSIGGKLAVLQTDGNFVIYSGAGVPLWNTGAGKPGGTWGPSVALADNGSLQVINTSGISFKSPGDPYYIPGGAGCSDHAQQYPVCLFPGTPSQFNGTVLACSQADAMAQAAASGARYGRCPGT